jgi:hypothetical protein
MTIKIYDGSTWHTQKSLRLYNGSGWSNAKKGWIYTGSAWSQFYPEYPLNTASPTVSGSTTQGQTLSSTTGTWNNNDAFLGTYTYQWTRAGSNISGATSSTYATVLGDVGNAIACKVTSTNDRGATTVTSSNSITVVSAIPGPPSGLSLSDATDTPPTPGAMSVSSITQTGFNFSFGAASGTFTAYEVLTSNSLHVVSSLNQSTRTGTITGGTAGEAFYTAAFTTNTNGKIGISWTAGTNATSYDIYLGGTYITNTSSTSIIITTGTVGGYNVNVRSRNSSGAESTGVSGSVTINKKYSSGGTAASGNFAAAPPPPAVSPSTPTNLVNVYTSGPSWAGSWSASTGTAPITYYWTLYQAYSSGGGITTTTTGNTTSTSFSQALSVGNGNWAYFTVYASNAGGTSSTATSSWA